MNNYKLAIIVPYRDRQEHMDVFIPHMDQFFSNKDIDYTIVVVEQTDGRPFNRGKLLNIGFDLVKDDFDYFCFHDVDLLPISDECDYSYEDAPIHLATQLETYNYNIPYPHYFGGVVIFNKENFIQLNGYSNEYWGYGVEDLDMMFRLENSGLPHDICIDQSGINTQSKYSLSEFKVIENTKNKKLKYVTLDGENTLHLKSSTELLTLPEKSYSISVWVRPHKLPTISNLPSSIKNGEREHSIISKPGFHTGLFYKSPIRRRTKSFDEKPKWEFEKEKTSFFQAQIWDENEQNYVVDRDVTLGDWYHLIMSVDVGDGSLSLYLNGIKAFDKFNRQKFDNGKFKKNLRKYSDSPWFIGCSYPEHNGFIGDISELKFYNVPMTPERAESEFLADEIDVLPIVHIDFSKGYRNTYFDITGNHCNLVSSLDIIDTHKSHYFKIGKELVIPIRKPGKYKCLKHTGDDKIVERYDNFDPDTDLNLEIFFDDIKSGDIDYTKIGLNSLNYKLVSEEDYKERHKWIKVIT